MKTTTHRTTLSFSLETKATLDLGYSGISTGTPIQDKEKQLSKLSEYDLVTSILDVKAFKDITNQDLVPKEEDFIDVPFRLISSTIVGSGTWKATDFRGKGLLKASMGKLLGKTVYKDHNQSADTWVGFIKAVKWSRAFTNDTGEKIPSGIDGILSIDSKTDPKLVRGLLLGTVYSNSVTVAFDWKPSHEFEDSWDFMRKIGTMDENNKQICRQVTSIDDYHETSLCWLGADPYAKAYDPKGNLKNVDAAKAYEEESAETKESYEKQNNFAISFSLNKKIISLSSLRDKIPVKTKTEKIIPMKKELLDKLRLMLGLAADAEITEANIAQLSKINPAQAELDAKAGLFDTMTSLSIVEMAKEEKVKVTLTGEKEKIALPEKFVEEYSLIKNSELAQTKLELKKVETLTQELAIAKTFEEAGKAAISFKRSECVRLYKVATEGGDEAVIKTFEEAKPEALDGLLKQFTKGATEKFTATCKKCNSTDVSFQSSFVAPVEETPAPSETRASTFNEILEKKDRTGFGFQKNN